jgi:hypothetical protein
MKRRAASATSLREGDVFAVPLPVNAHGLRYAAVRVLGANQPSALTLPQHMIAMTPFIGPELPTLDDPALREVLRFDGLGHTGQPIIVICCGAFPRDTVKVGNLPLSEDDRRHPFSVGTGQAGPDGMVTGFPLVGPISPARFGADAWREWRWRNDRAAFEAESAAARAETNRLQATRIHAPKKPMPVGAFWRLIALLDWEKSGDDDAVVAPVVKALAAGSVAAIKAFAETLAHMLFLLDTQQHAEQIGQAAWKGEGEPFSVDAFLYARCAAVANGRAFFQRVLESPSSMPKDIEFEALLYVPAAAYEERTGKTWDYETGCSSETFSNRAGWA